MNRTIEYERHVEHIDSLRKQSIEAQSAARAFGDYAEILKNLPTLGAVADRARDMLIDYAKASAEDCRKLIDANNTLADLLEAKGLPPE